MASIEPKVTNAADLDRMLVYCRRSVAEAATAMRCHPQPNCTLLKVAEEAGEVVKAGVHLSEGRDFTWPDLEAECVQTIAMCLRVLIEGDQTIGLIPPARQSTK